MASTWVEVPTEVAVKHRLYGIEGWSGALLVVQIFGPFLTVGLTLAVLFEDWSDETYSIPYSTSLPPLIFEAGLAIWSWINAYLLVKRNRGFYGLFWLRAPLVFFFGVIFSVTYYFPLVYVGNEYGALSAMILYVVRWPSALLWSCYLLFSKRLRVTLVHSVRKSDPILSEDLKQPT